MNDQSQAQPKALKWSLRRSFRDYLEVIDDGVEKLDQGAALDRDGRFILLSAGLNGSNPILDVMQFVGRIRFSGYGGLLSVALSNPRVDWNQEGGGSITVNTGPTRGKERLATIALFTKYRSLGTSLMIDHPRLTSAGVAMLGHVYEPGDLLDPIEIEL